MKITDLVLYYDEKGNVEPVLYMGVHHKHKDRVVIFIEDMWSVPKESVIPYTEIHRLLYEPKERITV